MEAPREETEEVNKLKTINENLRITIMAASELYYGVTCARDVYIEQISELKQSLALIQKEIHKLQRE